MMIGNLHMRKICLFSNTSYVWIWMLPWMWWTIYPFFKGLFALTGVVELVFMGGYYVAFLWVWLRLVDSFLNAQTQSKLNHSRLVTYEGKPHLLMPCDEDELKRVAEENRTFKEVVRGEAQ